MFESHGGSWDARTDWRTGRHVPRDPQRVRTTWRTAPQPGVLSRRPLKFFEGLDGGFRLLRFAPALTVGLALIVFTLWTLLIGAIAAGIVWASFGLLAQVFADPDATAGLTVIAQFGALAGSMLSLSLIHLLAGVTSIGTRAAFDSRRMTLAQGWRALRGVRWRLVLATLVLGGAHFASLIVASAPALVLAGLGQTTASAILLGLALLLWFAASAFFGIRTAFVGCTISVERVTIRRAFARSWRLTGRGFWRTTGQLLLGYYLSNQLVSIIITPIILIVYIVLIIVVLIQLGSAGSPAFAVVASVVVLVVISATTLAATAVLFAFLSALVSVVYVDVRMRQEGYDLILLREAEQSAAEDDGRRTSGTADDRAGKALR